MWDLLRISATVEASNFKFGTQLWFGTSLPIKNVLDQNWRGVGQGSIPKNLGPPTYFCNSGSQQLQIQYTTWVRDQLTKKQRLGPKLAGVWAKGSSKNFWDPVRIFATVKATNFKFGTHIGFGTNLPKTMFRTKIGGGLGQGSIQTKFGTPYVFLQPTEKLVHNRFQDQIRSGLNQKSTTPLPIMMMMQLCILRAIKN